MAKGSSHRSRWAEYDERFVSFSSFDSVRGMKYSFLLCFLFCPSFIIIFFFSFLMNVSLPLVHIHAFHSYFRSGQVLQSINFFAASNPHSTSNIHHSSPAPVAPSPFCLLSSPPLSPPSPSVFGRTHDFDAIIVATCAL